MTASTKYEAIPDRYGNPTGCSASKPFELFRREVGMAFRAIASKMGLKGVTVGQTKPSGVHEIE